MNALLIILLVLVVALVVIVPLIERFGPKYSDASMKQLSAWIFPMLILLGVVQLIMYYMD